MRTFELAVEKGLLLICLGNDRTACLLDLVFFRGGRVLTYLFQLSLPHWNKPPEAPMSKPHY